jgi:Fur family ferric uptake transcriptional regulator
MKYSEIELVNLIKDSGLKNTEHRLAILTRISKVKSPIAVHKLIEDLKKKYDIDQATVYRNLTSLEEVGILARSDYNHGHAHYEMSSDEVVHKIICNNCETMEKINASYFEEALKKLTKKSKKFQSSATNPSVDIYGLCKSCI